LDNTDRWPDQLVVTAALLAAAARGRGHSVSCPWGTSAPVAAVKRWCDVSTWLTIAGSAAVEWYGHGDALPVVAGQL
jgi:hypothetical protein